ncbi:MAG: hypothetical protein OEM39_05120 [Acidimicrobiia bacterium]|nr:hypothetical protein [Acidimicrobiia bacterium]MDH3462553.1 hypothetical protein [Acidimicrobiia bacterium]
MAKALTLIFIVLAACSGAAVDTTTTLVATTSSVPVTTTTQAETTTTAPPRQCPAAPYDVTSLPFTVGQGLLDPNEIEPDVWTSVGGTNTTFWGRPDGTVAIALIRGTLPAVDWPGDKGEVLIDGTRAAVGPHLDGTWVAGWYLEPRERCDLYTMVFYPPVAPEEVESTLLGMERTAG